MSVLVEQSVTVSDEMLVELSAKALDEGLEVWLAAQWAPETVQQTLVSVSA